MKKWIAQLDMTDVLILAGLILLTSGLGLYSVRLAISVLGILLLAIGLVSAWRKGVNQ